ncbi:flagellin [Acanthopleuribacter pedis]|uniref:Flagellin n=1 Tax=Acanthopleuribacter pedis TaxID=442870 RepID=A0A8J7QHB0_9BACT|nr:flagellin [Acanthopleuribacter pedis]MBO1320180.1 hypothetical protein [Acanthopleuribacter pedis]
MVGIFNNEGFGTQRRLGQAQNGLNNTLNRLSSGRRINSASDDAAGLQIANNLRADIRVLNQAQRNAGTGLAITNIADGSLTQANDLLTRAAEISLQAASGTTSDAGRDALNQELQGIFAELDSLGQNTRFDGQALFGSDIGVRVGENASEQVNISVDNLSAGDLGLAGIDLNDPAQASAAISQITGAIEQVSASRGSLGATQQRLNTTIESIQSQVISTQEAESQISDADVAEEVVNLTKLKILSESNVSALAQGNNLRAQNVLSLLN